MKFERIRQIIYASDCNRICDQSGRGESYVKKNRPLWFILENKRLDMRLWVVSDFGSLHITTAKLSAPVKSREYSDSQRRFDFKNQRAMESKLKDILACIEQRNDPSNIERSV